VRSAQLRRSHLVAAQNYTGFRNVEGLRQFRELCLQRGVKEEYESMPAVKIDAKPGKDADEHPAEDEEGMTCLHPPPRPTHPPSARLRKWQSLVEWTWAAGGIAKLL
jgi:hypothetical protein